MLARELLRSSDAPPAASSAVSPNLHLLRSFSMRPPTTSMAAGDFGSPLPCMSIAVHPRVPYVLVGSTLQRIRIATHPSELEED